MEETILRAEELFKSIKEYFNVKTERLKLETAEKVAKTASTFVSGALVLAFVFVFLLFVLLAMAVFLGKVLGGLHWGLLLMGGISLVIGCFLWLLRFRLLHYYLMNIILQHLLNEEDDDNEN